MGDRSIKFNDPKQMETIYQFTTEVAVSVVKDLMKLARYNPHSINIQNVELTRGPLEDGRELWVFMFVTKEPEPGAGRDSDEG